MRYDIAIIGLSPQGLALLRTFSKAGYNVLAIGTKREVGIVSKYGKIIKISSFGEVKNILETNIQNDTKVHITGDYFLNFLLKNWSEIFYKYKTMPTFEAATIFTNKLKTINLANKLKILYPCTKILSKININEYNLFPSILKWNVTYNQTPFKIKIINSNKELQKILQKMTPELKNNLILQQYINGRILSYIGYWEDGEEKLGIVVNQKRKLNGLTSCAVEIKDNILGKKMKDNVYKILSYVKYEGFVEVEFILAPNNELYLIEINPRACGLIKIIMEQFYQKLLLKNYDFNQCNKSLIWINIVRDVRAIFSIFKKERSFGIIKDIFNDYKNVSTFDILERDDLKPFLWQFIKNFL